MGRKKETTTGQPHPDTVFWSELPPLADGSGAIDDEVRDKALEKLFYLDAELCTDGRSSLCVSLAPHSFAF